MLATDNFLVPPLIRGLGGSKYSGLKVKWYDLSVGSREWGVLRQVSWHYVSCEQEEYRSSGVQNSYEAHRTWNERVGEMRAKNVQSS